MPVISVSISNEAFQIVQEYAEQHSGNLSATIDGMIKSWHISGEPTLPVKMRAARKERTLKEQKQARELDSEYGMLPAQELAKRQIELERIHEAAKAWQDEPWFKR